MINKSTIQIIFTSTEYVVDTNNTIFAQNCS